MERECSNFIVVEAMHSMGQVGSDMLGGGISLLSLSNCPHMLKSMLVPMVTQVGHTIPSMDRDGNEPKPHQHYSSS